MPVERVMTPRYPHVQSSVSIKQFNEAKTFTDCLIKFFIVNNPSFKFIFFGYLMFLTVFVFVVDPTTYTFREIGNIIYIAVAGIEFSLGSVYILAVLGLIRSRPIFLLPVLLQLICIFSFGVIYYLHPFTVISVSEAEQKMRMASDHDIIVVVLIISTLLFHLVLRSTPLLIQLVFIIFILKVIKCLRVIKKYKSQNYLDWENELYPTCNSRIWSAIQRKISSKQRQQQKVQVHYLPSRDLILEMSAEYRNSTFPTPA